MLGVLAAMLMQAAGLPSSDVRPSIITNPDWAQKPTGQDAAILYPKAALAARVEGRAVIQCSVVATGDLINCRVITEIPSDQGFGDAALAMSVKFKMKPRTRDGLPVGGGTVNIPIRFALPQSPGNSGRALPTMRSIIVTAGPLPERPVNPNAPDPEFHY